MNNFSRSSEWEKRRKIANIAGFLIAFTVNLTLLTADLSPEVLSSVRMCYKWLAGRPPRTLYSFFDLRNVKHSQV